MPSQTQKKYEVLWLLVESLQEMWEISRQLDISKFSELLEDNSHTLLKIKYSGQTLKI